MKKFVSDYLGKLRTNFSNQIEIYLTVGLLAFYFLGVGLQNNPLFSFTYNQGLTIALYIFTSFFVILASLKINKRFLLYVIIWLIYSASINLFINDGKLDIAFILKMPILFLLYAIFKRVHFSSKGFLALITIIFIAFALYGLKMLQVVILGYNLTSNKENSSVIGMAVAFGLLLAIPILRYILKLPQNFVKFLVPILYLAGVVTVFLLGARTTVLIILFTALLDYGIPMNIKKSGWFFACLAVLVYFLGIAFPILYNQLVKAFGFFSEHDFLTGREIIWGHLLDALKSNFKITIFGYGLDRQYGRWPHEHNGFLAIIMRYGLVGLGLFTAFWVSEIRKVFNHLTNKKQFQIELLYFVLPILLMAYTEPVIAIADYFVPIYFILALALTDAYKQDNSLGGFK